MLLVWTSVRYLINTFVEIISLLQENYLNNERRVEVWSLLVNGAGVGLSAEGWRVVVSVFEGDSHRHHAALAGPGCAVVVAGLRGGERGHEVTFSNATKKYILNTKM